MKRIKFFVLALVLATVALLVLDFMYNPDPGDILVEAHGMVLDIVLFGVILTIYEFYLNKREKLRDYAEELEDFKGWNESEAVYRNVGLIKRILRLKGNQGLIISRSYLKEANLIDLVFRRTIFKKLVIKQAWVELTKFDDCKFERLNAVGINLKNCSFNDCSFSGSVFSHSWFESRAKALAAEGHVIEFEISSLEFTSCNFYRCLFNFLCPSGEILFKNVSFREVSFCPLLILGELDRLVFEDCTFHDVVAWKSQVESFEFKNTRGGAVEFLDNEEFYNKVESDYELFGGILRIFDSMDYINFRQPKSYISEIEGGIGTPPIAELHHSLKSKFNDNTF